MTKGRAGTTTSDYKIHGTTTLFAALDVLTGSMIGSCMDKHRHEDFLKFLRTIDREVPKTLAVHMVLDNYATQNHPALRVWIAAHPRFHLHFTPTSSSWLPGRTVVREPTDKALRRGVSHSVPDLIASIEECMDVHNESPRPFVWTPRRIHPDQGQLRPCRPQPNSQSMMRHTTSSG